MKRIFNELLIRIPKLMLGALLMPIVLLMPRDKKKILFGAWGGTQFADNPKYFLLYLMKQNLGYKFYWIGNKSVKMRVESIPGIKFVKKGSLLAIWHILTAKWMCCNIRIGRDVTNFPTFGRVTQINFWHGTSYKGLVAKNLKPPAKGNFLKELWRLTYRFESWAWTQKSYGTFSSKKMCTQMPLEAPYSFAEERSIGEGSPRIDFLINNAKNQSLINELKGKYAKILGLPINKKWFLYVPTWRKGLALKFSFLKSECLNDYNRVLQKKDAVLIEKQHPQVMSELGIEKAAKGNVYAMSAGDAANHVDIQELYLCADLLITDYSSVFCDYGTLNRPVIHWAYDYDWFLKNDKGFEYPLSEVSAGPVVKTEKELIEVLNKPNDELLSLRGPHVKDLISGEQGHACEAFAKWIGLVK